MKPPYIIGAVCIAMALAACSGAQTGSTNAIPAVSTPQRNIQKLASAVILVANEGAGTGGSISEFVESANGNVAPSSIVADRVGVPGPYAVAFSKKEGVGIADGNLDSNGQVGAETIALATGEVLTQISCFGKPNQTNAVAFDSTGHLYVTTAGSGVEVFSPGASGCVKPKRTISDAGGLAIDSNNVLYVANAETATIDIFPAGSSTMQAQIGGSNTGLGTPGMGALPADTVAIDASRNVYVFDPKTATISEFAAGAHGNVAPIRTIAGSNTGLGGGTGFSFGIAVSKASGEIFISNSGSNAILGFAANASGDVAPIQTISGSATRLSNPLGIVVTE